MTCSAHVVLEARLSDALRQRDELLEAVDTWGDALDEGEWQRVYDADEALKGAAEQVRREIWANGE